MIPDKDILLTNVADLDMVRDNLFSQHLEINKFLAQLYAIVTANLAEHKKMIQRVVKPLTTTAGRMLGEQQALINAVVEPLLTQAQARLAEQNIMLGNVSAELLGATPRARPTAPVEPMRLPPSVPTTPRPLRRASTTTREGQPTDSVVGDTLAGFSPADLPLSSPVPSEAPALGETTDADEGQVTNVVAIRKCDLDALLAAITKPVYNPYVDAARGLLSSDLDKLEPLFGVGFLELAGQPDTEIVGELFVRAAAAKASGSTAQ
jgi:hypothetical protein